MRSDTGTFFSPVADDGESSSASGSSSLSMWQAPTLSEPSLASALAFSSRVAVTLYVTLKAYRGSVAGMFAVDICMG